MFVRKIDIFESDNFSKETKDSMKSDIFDKKNDEKYDEISELFSTNLYNKIKINDEGEARTSVENVKNQSFDLERIKQNKWAESVREM